MFIRFQCSFFPLILREKKQTIRLHRYWILHMDIEPKITYHGVKELIYITAFFNVTLSCVLNSWGIIDPSWRRKWPTPVFLPGKSHGERSLEGHSPGVQKSLTQLSVQFSSVQSLSRVRLFATPWIVALAASLSITNCRSLPKLMSIESVMPSNHLI